MTVLNTETKIKLTTLKNDKIITDKEEFFLACPQAFYDSCLINDHTVQLVFPVLSIISNYLVVNWSLQVS